MGMKATPSIKIGNALSKEKGYCHFLDKLVLSVVGLWEAINVLLQSSNLFPHLFHILLQ